jgi:hypothetical protein
VWQTLTSRSRSYVRRCNNSRLTSADNQIQNLNNGIDIIIEDPAVHYCAVIHCSQNPGAQHGITSRGLAPSYLRTDKRPGHFTSEPYLAQPPGTTTQPTNKVHPEHQESAPSADAVEQR